MLDVFLSTSTATTLAHTFWIAHWPTPSGEPPLGSPCSDHCATRVFFSNRSLNDLFLIHMEGMVIDFRGEETKTRRETMNEGLKDCYNR